MTTFRKKVLIGLKESKELMKRSNSHFSIGLDLGGTKLAAALINEKGSILRQFRVPIELGTDSSPSKAQRRVIGLMGDMIEQLVREFPKETKGSKFRGIGLASAGPMDILAGNLVQPSNFPGWKTFPILRLVREVAAARGLKTHVQFQNDAIAAALAEGWVGHARGLSSFAVITIGTGIGTGVIFEGRPCQSRGMGSEFGHMIVEPGTTVEEVAAGPALIRSAQRLGIPVENLHELVQDYPDRVPEVFAPMSDALSSLCYNLSIGFHLQGMFISGGVSALRKYFLKDIVQKYKQKIHRFNPAFECPIRFAKTGNDAGVVGAAALCFMDSGKQK